MKNKKVFDHLLLSIKHGEYWEHAGKYYVNYQDTMHTIVFCWEPKPRHIHITVDDKKPKSTLFKEAKSTILDLVNPPKSWTEITTEYNTQKTVTTFKGMKQFIIEVVLAKRIKNITR